MLRRLKTRSGPLFVQCDFVVARSRQFMCMTGAAFTMRTPMLSQLCLLEYAMTSQKVSMCQAFLLMLRDIL